MDNPTCEVEDCDKPQHTKRMCGSHYMRWRRYGDPLAQPKPRERERAVCVIQDCDKLHEARGWCKVHYDRYLYYGDPVVVPAKPKLEPKLCSIEGCDKLHSGRGWCKEHYDRWVRYGDPLGEWVPRIDITYAGAHDRVRYRRGASSEHRCQSCGDPAAEWAYDAALRVVPSAVRQGTIDGGETWRSGSSSASRSQDRARDHTEPH